MSIDMLLTDLISTIKIKRELLEMTHRDIGEKVGVPAWVIEHLENGKEVVWMPSILTILNVCQALEIITSYEIKEKVDGK